MLERLKQVIGFLPTHLVKNVAKYVLNISDVTIIIQGGEKRIELETNDLAYSFSDLQTAVSPWIIKNLLTSLADKSAVTSSIFLHGSSQSNQFIESIVSQNGFLVSTRNDEKIMYRQIGRTDSGLYILHTVVNSGGSGRFHDLLFVEIYQRDVVEDFLNGSTKTVLELRSLGAIVIGDRFSGVIEFTPDQKLYVSGRSQENKVSLKLNFKSGRHLGSQETYD